MLFGARRYAEARSAFQDLQRVASGDDRELVDLRVAECDFYLRRYEAARDAVRPYMERASRKAEARFFHLSALRELGVHEEYVAQTRALIADFPGDSWSEEALNNLGTHYLVTNQDEAAAQAFAELFEKFPTGTRAERAAWKAGWWSYRKGDFAASVRTFEGAAATFPRSDYRPSYLYWAARAHAALGHGEAADVRFVWFFPTTAALLWPPGAKYVARAAGAAPAVDRAVAAAFQVPRPQRRRRPPTASGCCSRADSTTRHSTSCDSRSVMGHHPAIERPSPGRITRKAAATGDHADAAGVTPVADVDRNLLPAARRQVLGPAGVLELIKKHATLTISIPT